MELSRKRDVKMNDGIKILELPVSRNDLEGLRAGDKVKLTGPLYTMRDAGHERCLAELERTGKLPFGLEGQTLFYAGPTPATAGRPFGSIGPTTASRMDFATPALLKAGIVATIGKGKRSSEVVQACRETKSVYFAAVGGIAALLAKCVISTEDIAWEDLGTEALRKIVVEELPVYVEIDTNGNDLYRQIEDM